jgi:hypothetical protein
VVTGAARLGRPGGPTFGRARHFWTGADVRRHLGSGGGASLQSHGPFGITGQALLFQSDDKHRRMQDFGRRGSSTLEA